MDQSQNFKKHVITSQTEQLIKQLESTWTRSSAKEDIKQYIRAKEQELQELGEKYNSLLEQYSKLNQQNYEQNKQKVNDDNEKQQIKQENNALQKDKQELKQIIEQSNEKLKLLQSQTEIQKHFEERTIDYFKLNQVDNYDISIKFEKLSNFKEGLKIQNFLSQSLKYWDRKTQIVGIIGNSNTGKTFLMSSLTRKMLRQGLIQKTQGINIVSTEIQENHVFFIDTPGSGEPLSMFQQYQNLQEDVARLSKELKSQSFKDFYTKNSKYKRTLININKYSTMSFQIPTKFTNKEIASMFQEENIQQINPKKSFEESSNNNKIDQNEDSDKEELEEENQLRQLYEKTLKEKTQKIKELKAQIHKHEELILSNQNQYLYESLLYEKFIQNFVFETCHLIVIVVGSMMTKEDEKLINYVSKLFQATPQKEIIIVHNFYQNIVSKEDIQQKIKQEIIDCFHVEEGTAPIGVNRFCNVYKDYSYQKSKPIIHLIIGLKNTVAGNYYNEHTLDYLKQRIGSIQTQAQNFNFLENFKNYLNKNLNQYIKIQSEESVQPKFDFLIEEKSTDLIIIESKYLQQKQYTVREIDYQFFGKFTTNIRQDNTPDYDIWEDSGEVCINIDLPGIEDKNQIKFQFPINNQTNAQYLALSTKRIKSLPEDNQNLSLKETNDKNIIYGDLSLYIPIFAPASDLRQDKDGKKVYFKNNVLTIRLSKQKSDKIAEEFVWQE